MQVGQNVTVIGNGLHGDATIMAGTTPQRDAMGFILVCYHENKKLYWVEKKNIR